jgi:multisubunit Na+/H+ antiporter MnhB subunit
MKRPDSFILESFSRIAFFFINLFALYLLLRGHNLPGGGFIAGLVTAISFIFLSMALGLEEIRNILVIDPIRFGVCGLILAVLTALSPMLAGERFFTHHMWHFHLPLLGEVEAGTTLLFDLGVYFIVVAVSVKIILVLAWSTSGITTFPPDEVKRYASVLEQPIERTTSENQKTEKGASGAD